MDTTRYVLGVLLIVGLAPAVVFWLFIHPFARFWRRAGAAATYLIVGAACVALGVAVYRHRAALLGADLGTSWVLIAFGAVLYAASAWISVLTRRQLKLGAFAGLPEVARREAGGTLLQEGVYGVIRHPRYVSVIIGTAGFAMFVNHVGAYLMVLATVPALWLVVIVEERELAHRFGAEYERYRSRVPAFFPGLPRRRPRAPRPHP